MGSRFIDLVVCALIESPAKNLPLVVDAYEDHATVAVTEGNQRFLEFVLTSACFKLDAICLAFDEYSELFRCVASQDLDHVDDV